MGVLALISCRQSSTWSFPRTSKPSTCAARSSSTTSRCTRTTTQTESSAHGLPGRASRHGVQSRLLVCFASRCKRCASTQGGTRRDRRHTRTIRAHTINNTPRNPTHTDTRTNTRNQTHARAHTSCASWSWFRLAVAVVGLLAHPYFRFLVLVPGVVVN